jgi:hypothetical protein
LIFYLESLFFTLQEFFEYPVNQHLRSRFRYDFELLGSGRMDSARVSVRQMP